MWARLTMYSKSTCWRRLNEWTERDVFLKMFRTLLAELNATNRIDWEEAFIDGTFASAKKGGTKSGKQNAVRAQRL